MTSKDEYEYEYEYDDDDDDDDDKLVIDTEEVKKEKKTSNNAGRKRKNNETSFLPIKKRKLKEDRENIRDCADCPNYIGNFGKLISTTDSEVESLPYNDDGCYQNYYYYDNYQYNDTSFILASILAPPPPPPPPPLPPTPPPPPPLPANVTEKIVIFNYKIDTNTILTISLTK